MTKDDIQKNLEKINDEYSKKNYELEKELDSQQSQHDQQMIEVENEKS